MKKRRLLRIGSALALLLSVGVIAACEEETAVDEPVIEEPAEESVIEEEDSVIEEEEPAIGDEEPATGVQPPATGDQPPPIGEEQER